MTELSTNRDLSIVIMKIIDEWERCDKGCAVMGWINSEVQLRQ